MDGWREFAAWIGCEILSMTQRDGDSRLWVGAHLLMPDGQEVDVEIPKEVRALIMQKIASDD
jgi:hypothetical protein